MSFQLPNWWQFVALHLGCVYAGAITNPLMPIFRADKVAIVVGDDRFLGLITKTDLINHLRRRMP